MHGRQEIHATDFSESCVDLVAKRFATTPHFKGATLIRSLPSELPGGFFDVVLATEVIEHLLDQELAAMLVECDRVLKPGGRVFFTTPNEEDYDAAKVICPDCGSVFHRWQHVRTWTVASLRTRMEQAGFTTEIAKPVTWLNWRGKLLSWLTERRIVRNGLLYVGRKAV
jgi:2-polyprenyl-3-methyl-5-hydroxy-6-metoxy-1,4-benzoquinol methylase